MQLHEQKLVAKVMKRFVYFYLNDNLAQSLVRIIGIILIATHQRRKRFLITVQID